MNNRFLYHRCDDMASFIILFSIDIVLLMFGPCSHILDTIHRAAIISKIPIDSIILIKMDGHNSINFHRS